MNPEIYNKLPQLEKSQTTATLSDGSRAFEFLVPPQAFNMAYRQERANLNVLGTDAAVSRWKHSQHNLSLPDVRLWTPGNRRDLTEPLETLQLWTQGDPPVLKFQWGSLGLERCYLISFDFNVTQIRAGKPTQASGSMELAPAPEILEPEKDKSGDAVELSEREAEEYSELLEAAFPDAERIVLRPDGTVILDGVELPETIFDIKKAAANP